MQRYFFRTWLTHKKIAKIAQNCGSDGQFEMKSLTSLVPCPFTGPKMICACPNFLSQPKNLTALSASSKTFVLAQKEILLNANHLLVWHKMFVTGTICK